MINKTKQSSPHFFFLCPDPEFARALRQYLVTNTGTVFAEVGTIDQLIELAYQKYLLDLDPELNTNSLDRFTECLTSLVDPKTSDYFWSNSFAVDPQGVSNNLADSILKLLNVEFGGRISDWTLRSKESAINSRLADLQVIFNCAKRSRSLPIRTQKIINIIECNEQPITPICVITSSVYPIESGLINRLVEKLTNDCVFSQSSGDLNDRYKQLSESFAQSYNTPLAKVDTNLHFATSSLFKPIQDSERQWNPHDGSFQWLRCRDRLESIEIILGMIQKTMSVDSTLNYSDFGLLIPHKFDAHSHLVRLFDKFGVPLANLQWAETERNLAGELLSAALMALEGVSPKLSLKSLLTNPLMPWDIKTAGLLADSLDQYGFSIKPPKNFHSNWRAITDLFKGIERAELPSALKQIFAILRFEGISEIQQQNTKDLFELTIRAAENPSNSFQAIRSLVSQAPLQVDKQVGPFLEGVTVFYEQKYPWRKVQYLYVLDFLEGSFPPNTNNPAVLSDQAWRKLKTTWPELQLATEERAQARELFVRQLSCVQKHVSFFCPAFDELGNTLSPSDSLIDFALLKGKDQSPEMLLLEVGSEIDQSKIEQLKIKSNSDLQKVRFVSDPKDIYLNLDLLANWTKPATDEVTGETVESLKPQSPSALDDLLICPLGWLLKQMGADNRVWEPDGFTPMTSGLIAHDVMEQLFAVDQGDVPSIEAIESKVSALFDEAVKKKAPFLTTAIWQVERKNLLGIVRKAALQWAELLEKLGARVVAPELWLQGTFDGHPIHGQTDSVIALPDSGVLVVDFKTAKAEKYEKRMKARLDLQASLYEQMLLSGGPKNPKDVEKAKNANLKKLNGVVYFTLKDCIATSNFVPTQFINGWRAVEPLTEDGEPSPWSQDVSSEAMKLLKTRFGELKEGKVSVIKASEIQSFQKQGFGAYIYDSSPLIRLGIVDDQTEQTEGDDE